MILNSGIGGSSYKGGGTTAWDAMNKLKNGVANAQKQKQAAANSKPAVNYTSTKVVAPVKKVTTTSKVVPKVVTKPVAKPTGHSGVVVTGGGGSVAPVAPAVSNAGYLALAKKSSDYFYKGQEAGFARTRDQQIADVGKAYNDAVAEGKISIQDATDAYNQAVKDINHQSYIDSQLTNTTAFSRGIQNSQQLAGLMLGDQARANTNKNDVSTERNKRVQALNDRIAQLTKQKDLDIAQAKTDYNYNITGARADADKMYVDAQMANYGGGSGGGGGGYSSGGGSRSGGGSGSKTSSYNVTNESNLAKEYKNFTAAKKQTTLDNYNTRMNNLGKRSVVQVNYRNPLGAPPTVANNPNMSAWEKMKLLGAL